MASTFGVFSGFMPMAEGKGIKGFKTVCTGINHGYRPVGEVRQSLFSQFGYIEEGSM